MNKKDIWIILENQYQKDSSDFGIPVEDNTLMQEGEKTLGVKFSDQYIYFLSKFGGAIMPGHIVYGLIPRSEKGYLKETVVTETKFFKETQQWPDIESWYIISDDGRGNPIGIDPEGKVWLSDHDSAFKQIKLADSFEEFLYKLHTDTLYD
jgi:hypothetical protein